MIDSTATVVRLARQAYADCWAQENAGVSARTLAAQAVTREWQGILGQISSESYKVEVPVSPRSRERIDVVDLHNGIAFELKVSENNPQHEFYKDLFKVREFNKGNSGQLRHLVFIAPRAGISRLQRGIAGSLLEDSEDLGFSIRFEELD